MTKRFTNQYCVHCLGVFQGLTKDHIFPESWFPTSTPEGIEKWVAPACFACNNKLGKIEEELYKKLALSVTKDDIAASGVSEKVSHLYKPNTAKDENDKNRKMANVRKLFPDLVNPKKLPAKAFAKNCGLKDNDIDKSFAVYVSFELLNPFAEKVIRGLEFKLRNKLIDSGTKKIEIIFPPVGIENIASQEIQELNNILNTNGIKVNRGPGFTIKHAIDKYGTSLYHVTIWGKIEFWGSVANKSLSQRF